jgi:hypothetical protein
MLRIKIARLTSAVLALRLPFEVHQAQIKKSE